MFGLGHAGIDHHPDEARHQGGGGRAGDALKVALVDDADVGIEARETHRRTGAVDEGCDPASTAKILERPLVHDQRGCRAEADHVGEAVELLAEFGLGMRHARDAAIHAIEHHGVKNEHRGLLEAAVHALHDGVKRAKQRGQRDRIGQQVYPALAQFGVHQAAAGFVHAISWLPRL